MKTLFPAEHTNFEADTTEQQHSLPIADCWKLLQLELQNQLDQQSYEKWVLPIGGRERGQNLLVLEVPSNGFKAHFDSHLLPLVEACKNNLNLGSFEVIVEAAQEEDNLQTIGQEKKLKEGACEPEMGTEAAPLFSASLSKNSRLNQNYTFDTFVKGPSNQFALASCHNVAEHPGESYNPLFLYGSTGLGKTHLLHAVGNYVLKNNPKSVVTYISSERFMNEMIYCIRHNKMWDFRRKYRHCDVFMMDDIQFISGNKAATQEEFFHTFNTLYEAKKQIIITSDLFPQDIPDIEERLRNRFQWGLIADIQPPDIEHRIAILMNKADKLNVPLSYEIAEYIANHAKKNVRELEGALHRIVAFAALQGKSISKAVAMETFQNLAEEPPKRLEIETIQKAVANHFKVRMLDLKSKKRQRALTIPRQIAMYLCRQKTSSSFPEIGERFGGKDHTTVMHAVRKITKERANDLDIKAHLEALERHLEQQ